MSKREISGYLLVLMAAMFWAATGPLARHAQEVGLDPLETSFWRAFFGGVCFLVQALVTGRWRATGKQRIACILFAVPGISLMYITFQIGIYETGVALASVLQYTSPMWVGIWSFALFKEGMNRFKFLSILLACLGAALATLSGGGLPHGGSTWGIFCSVFSGFLFSLHFIFDRKYLKEMSSITIYMHIMLAGALFMLPFIDFMPNKDSSEWFQLVLLGVLTGWAGYWAYAEGLKRISATKVSVTATAEPLIAVVMAFFWWGERLPLIGWVGCLLIVAGVLCSLKKVGPQDLAAK